MESNGRPGKIQASQATADRLISAGKARWVEKREDLIEAKGKGKMQTYWIELASYTAPSQLGASVSEGRAECILGIDYLDERIARLIDWNTDILAQMLRQIVSRRCATKHKSEGDVNSVANNDGRIVIDEVKEVIKLPEFDAAALRNQVDPESVQLDMNVLSELRDFVVAIASSYQNNSFHNFEHCSHVTMSVVKLLGRIVSGGRDASDSRSTGKRSNAKQDLSLHRQTYGITSDPLTQFACVFSALIHDIGHTGVPNGQLAKEFPLIANKYRNQSLAEQRSVDIAWELLMAPCYSNLRKCIYCTKEDRDLFRQLVVNSVIATDIFDPELGALRKARWEKAFVSEKPEQPVSVEDVNRKATIVVEYLIQASDVAHTMQHWHIYSQWNQRLFNEMYKAFELGRSEKDPSEGWYQGELWFFDNYVIPLAKKLKDCGVFGVSSDEYLTYAMENRQEWERKGEQIVQAMVEQYGRKEDSDESSEGIGKTA
jgi:hypothetical protein